MLATLRLATHVRTRKRFGFFRVAPRPFSLQITVYHARRPSRRRTRTQKKPNVMGTITYKLQYKTTVSDSCPVWRSIILLKEEDQPEKTQIGRIARPRSHRHNIVRGPTGQTGRRPRIISPHPSPHISPHLIYSLVFPAASPSFCATMLAPAKQAPA